MGSRSTLMAVNCSQLLIARRRRVIWRGGPSRRGLLTASACSGEVGTSPVRHFAGHALKPRSYRREAIRESLARP